MSKAFSRTPKEYNGTKVTTHRMNDLIPFVLEKITEVYQQQPELVLAAWPELIGAKLAKMTQAVSFKNGVLVVNVKNSTLYSLLSQNEKSRLTQLLRGKFPRVEIKTIVFRIG